MSGSSCALTEQRSKYISLKCVNSWRGWLLFQWSQIQRKTFNDFMVSIDFLCMFKHLFIRNDYPVLCRFMFCSSWQYDPRYRVALFLQGLCFSQLYFTPGYMMTNISCPYFTPDSGLHTLIILSIPYFVRASRLVSNCCSSSLFSPDWTP